MRVTQHHPKPNAAPAAGRAPLQVDVHPGRKATVVAVAGELDAASSHQLADALTAAGHGGHEVQLDLAATTFIDSAGIRVLVRSMWALRDVGSDLRLVSASPLAENILRITGILDVLKDPAP